MCSGAAWETMCKHRNRLGFQTVLTADMDEAYGWEASKSFDHVIVMDKQHRIKGDHKFAAIASTFASEDPGSAQQIGSLCDFVLRPTPPQPASGYSLMISRAMYLEHSILYRCGL